VSSDDVSGTLPALAPEVDPADVDLEATLRPRRLTEFIGQARVREQLDLVLEGARRRGAGRPRAPGRAARAPAPAR